MFSFKAKTKANCCAFCNVAQKKAKKYKKNKFPRISLSG